MRTKRNNLIIVIIGIIFLSFFTTFSNAADSSDDWGVKEGDIFTYNVRAYRYSSEKIRIDCTGTTVITIGSISANGTLTFNLKTNMDCSDLNQSTDPTSHNITDQTTNFIMDPNIYSMYPIINLPLLNTYSGTWGPVVESWVNNLEEQIRFGAWNGTISASNDSLGYSIKGEGLASPQYYPDGNTPARDFKIEETIRYKTNGVLEKFIRYQKIGNDSLEEISYVLEEKENNISGINVDILLGFSFFCIVGLIHKNQKKVHK